MSRRVMSENSPPPPATELEFKDTDSQQQRLEKLQWVIAAVKEKLQKKDVNSSSFRNLVLKLVQSYYFGNSLNPTPQTKRQMQLAMADELISSGVLPPLCKRALQTFREQKDACFVEEGDLNTPVRSLKLVWYVLTMFQNFSDLSESFAVAASKMKDLLLLCKEMQLAFLQPLLKAKLLNDVITVLQQSLSVVYNLYFKRNEDIDSRLQKYNFSDCVRPYCSGDTKSATASVEIRLRALLVLMYSSSADQDRQLDDSIAKQLVEKLRKAMRSSDRRCQGFDVIELAKNVQFLAARDSCRSLLRANGIVEVSRDGLAAKRIEEIQELLKLLLLLAVDAEAKKDIKEQCSAELSSLKGSSSFSSSRTLEQLLHLSTDRESETDINDQCRTEFDSLQRNGSFSDNHTLTPIVELNGIQLLDLDQ